MSDWIERRENLDYDSAVALRYHGHRKAFLDVLSRLDPALSLVFGATAFATILAGHSNLAASAGLIVTISSALNLAFGVSDKARLHENLFQQWGGLRAGLANLTDEDDLGLRRLEVLRAEIDAKSPWQLTALSVICENEEKKVRRRGLLFRVSWLQLALANWFTFPWWRPVEDNDETSRQVGI